MVDGAHGALVVRDHGAPEWGRPAYWRGRPAAALDLPSWEDSCLCRAMRLYGLSGEEVAAAQREGEAVLGVLREAMMAEGGTEGQWQYLRQVAEARCVTPLVESLAIVRHIVSSSRPELLAARVGVFSRQWWTGRAWAATAARAAAAEAGLPAEVVFTPAWAGVVVKALPFLVETLRGVLMRRRGRAVLRCLAARGAKEARTPQRADVLLLASGPVVEGLAARLAGKLRQRGATCELARDPLAPVGMACEEFLRLGPFADVTARKQAMRLVAGGPRRAARLAQVLAARLSGPYAEALRPRLMALECRDRPLVEWLEGDAQAFLDAVRPKVVVAFHFLPRLATPYLVDARRRGAATVWCQHGLMVAPDYESPWFDRCLVFNEYSAELVRPRACGADVRIVGNPALDGLLESAARGSGKCEEGIGDGRSPSVLVAAQPNDPPDSDRREGWWFSAVAGACAAAGVQMKVKLHPQQSAEREGEMYRRAMAAAGAEGAVIPHGAADLGALISACDVFVSQFSTSLLDAIVLGKPTVFVELRPGPPFYPFDDFGMARRVTEPGQMLSALQEALRGPAPSEEARKAFAQRHLEPLDGHALDRMADEILLCCG